MAQEQNISQQLAALLRPVAGNNVEDEPKDGSRFTVDCLTRQKDETQAQAQEILKNNRQFYSQLAAALSGYNGLNLATFENVMKQPKLIPHEVARLVVKLNTYFTNLSALSQNDLEVIMIAFSQTLAGWEGGKRNVRLARWSADGLVSPSIDNARRIIEDPRFTKLIDKTGNDKLQLIDLVFMTLVACQDYYQALQLVQWAERNHHYSAILSKLSPVLDKLIQAQAGAFNRRLLGALSLVNDPNQSDKAVNITDPTNIANEARKALIQLGERGVLEWQRQQEVISLYKLVQELDPTSLQTRIRTILAEDGQPSTDLQALEKFGDELARKIAVALQVNQLLSSLVRAIHPEVTAQLELQKAQSEATGHTGALTAFPENELVASYGREFQEAETDERKLIIAKPMRPSQFADLLRNPDSGFNLRALISYLKNPKLFFSLLNEETSRSENPNQKQQAETAKQIVLRHLAAGLDWLQSMRDRRLADYNPLLEELATTLGTDAITRHNFEQSYHTFEEHYRHLLNQPDFIKSIEAELAQLLPQLAQFTDESGLLASIKQLVHSNIDSAARTLLKELTEKFETETQTQKLTLENNKQTVASLNQQIEDAKKSIEQFSLAIVMHQLLQEISIRDDRRAELKKPIILRMIKHLFSGSGSPKSALTQKIDNDISATRQKLQKAHKQLEELERQREIVLAEIQQPSNQSTPLAAQIQKLESWLASRSGQNS